MFCKPNRTIWGNFPEVPIGLANEIYQTSDGEFSIHLGLFRKDNSDIFLMKFVHKSFMTHTSTEVRIVVDTFQHFADFVGLASTRARNGAGIPRRLPLFPLICCAVNEGISHSALLGEYKSQKQPDVLIRFFAYKNRRAKTRILFEQKAFGTDTYEIFDVEALDLIQREIELRQH